jgi:tRNA (guanine37-N1)-methyltransferase
MEIYVVALFPEILRSFASASIVARAVQDERVRFHEVQIRDFSTNKHRTVDDTPCGGGSGMVMAVPPIVAALESIPESAPVGDEPARRARRILMTPQGQRFDQRIAERLAKEPALAFVCGRYEGFDDRVRHYVDEEISIGDFVLTGGEPAALIVIDAVVRLIPGVLGNAESATTESHGAEGLLEYPQYTRPIEFRGESVPPILLSGDHKKIATWRRIEALKRTRLRRPDLYARLSLSAKERAQVEEGE